MTTTHLCDLAHDYCVFKQKRFWNENRRASSVGLIVDKSSTCETVLVKRLEPEGSQFSRAFSCKQKLRLEQTPWRPIDLVYFHA